MTFNEATVPGVVDLDGFGDILGIEVDGLPSQFPNLVDGELDDGSQISLDGDSDIGYIRIKTGNAPRQVKGTVTLQFDGDERLAHVSVAT